jgi:hypothetical protein
MLNQCHPRYASAVRLLVIGLHHRSYSSERRRLSRPYRMWNSAYCRIQAHPCSPFLSMHSHWDRPSSKIGFEMPFSPILSFSKGSCSRASRFTQIQSLRRKDLRRSSKIRQRLRCKVPRIRACRSLSNHGRASEYDWNLLRAAKVEASALAFARHVILVATDKPSGRNKPANRSRTWAPVASPSNRYGG